MKNFQHKGSIVFFDLETTGVDVENDRIVQIAAVKFDPFGERTELVSYVNPGRKIPAEATEVHHITDEMVADARYFSEIAGKVAGFFAGCAIGGYNILRFDIPFLLNELARYGHSLDLNVPMVDALQIFFQREPRDLEGALKFYCGKQIEGAHDALVDVDATIAVLEGQMEMYEDLPRTAAGIWEETRDPDAVDLGGKLRWENGEIVLTFGKNKGVALRQVGRSYLSWMLKNNVIGPDADMVIRDAMRGQFYKRD
jgi:DNA polymerase-3 subunit epsilon